MNTDTYISPSLKVIRINVKSIICASPVEGPSKNESFTETELDW